MVMGSTKAQVRSRVGSITKRQERQEHGWASAHERWRWALYRSANRKHAATPTHLADDTGAALMGVRRRGTARALRLSRSALRARPSDLSEER
ncbi:hypothetical protein C8Q80DRAFT_222456 [Daedaleopsis nitida]|nr:hypothetical protein C8Q80DRAFT_222456 [Daedaleopsis nitida]